MSLFANPRVHADNPPNSWEVVKVGRRWALRTKDGDTLDTFPTKQRAEEERFGGFFANLYDKERRWYAGENIHGWKRYEAERCPVCGREVRHWPLQRRLVCAPEVWVYCIRDLEQHAAQARTETRI